MTKEKWKPIKGYEKRYEISNKGRIKSLVGFCYRKTVTTKDNNEQLMLCKKDYKGNLKYETFLVHRLVADHFIKSLSVKDFVSHKDGDNTNNNVSNLQLIKRNREIKKLIDRKISIRKRKSKKGIYFTSYFYNLENKQIYCGTFSNPNKAFEEARKKQKEMSKL